MNRLAVATRAIVASRDRATSVLTVLAFALPHAVMLSVVGGLLAFINRSNTPTTPAMAEDFYVVLAAVATVLLVIPAATMGAAAARLGLSKRARDLAVLRLIGVTPTMTRAACVADTSVYALAGTAVGSVIYVLALPIWGLITFQEVPLTAAEMWVGVLPLLGLAAAMVALAALSAWIAVQAVAITPLGVARHAHAQKVSGKLVLLTLVLGVVWLIGGGKVMGFGETIGVTILLGFLALLMALSNVVGSWSVSMLGRTLTRFARTPEMLLAGRRLIDDPKSVWRSYGSIPLVAFIAGVMYPAMTQMEVTAQPVAPDVDPELAEMMQVQNVFAADLGTGMLLTLVITFVLAAIATAVNQSIRAIEGASQVRSLLRAGAAPRVLDRARRMEVTIPAVIMVSTSMVLGMAFTTPLVVASGGGILALLAVCATGVVGTVMVLFASEVAVPVGNRALRELA